MHNTITESSLPLPTAPVVFDPQALYAHLQRVTDKQDHRGRRYPLAPLLAIDGKTLRGTIPSGQTQGVHLFAAYIPQRGWRSLT